MNKSYQYSKEYHDFSSATYISAPLRTDDYADEREKIGFPEAKYIWPIGCTRFHACRLFTPREKPIRAEAAFVCDNLFDLWINGAEVACDTKRIVSADITDFICEGENNLHIRGYQSDSYKRFSSAITGGIRLYYADGSSEQILTDGEFRHLYLVDFWVTEEPEGFETARPDRYRAVPMNVMDYHPSILRRSNYFKHSFKLEKMPVKARMLASAKGCYEPYINGERVNDSFFMPFSLVYEQEYQDFDILHLLKTGMNTVGAITGNGWYNCSSWGSLRANVPAFIATVVLEYEDGRTEYINTDRSWICAPSPLVENDLQYGERYDARLEIDNWCSPCTDGFIPVSYTENEAPISLLLQSYPYVKKAKEYEPKLLHYTPEGYPLYDVGSCISGRARVKFRGLKRGQDIKIRYCERLADDGVSGENGAYVTVYYQNDCAPDGRSPYFVRNLDVYTAKGEKEESYECRFAYTGYRYIWIEGLESPEQLVKLTPFEIRSELEEVGSIITDCEPINRIFNATRRSWLNNICNGPTDCPTREKNFWNGDSEIFSHSACWLTDNSAFLSRWTDNGIKMHAGPYAWEDETYVMPLTLYRFYGDKEILRARFPEMLKLIDKRTEYEGMILPSENSREYCDWLSPKGVTPSKLFFKGCWYYRMLSEVSRVAEIIGEDEKAAELRVRADAAKEEFNRVHLLAEEKDYDARCQCGIVLPLAFGICPDEMRQDLADTLNEYVKREDYHLTTGFIGTRFLPDVLADGGYADTVYRLIAQDTFPSWLNMLDGGATAVTESWLGLKDPDKSVSMSHFSLGGIIGWFFEYLGGIRINDSEPGMARIVLRPHPIKEVGSFAVKYKSRYGEIYTEWHYEGDTPVFSYKLPDGVCATVEF